MKIGQWKENFFEELSRVLWAFKMITHSSIGEISFLTYETNHMIHIDVLELSWITLYLLPMDSNKESYGEKLDLLIECKE